METNIKMNEKPKKKAAIREWISEHKGILIAAGAFAFGMVVKGAIDAAKHSEANVALDIYNKAVGYSNDNIIPKINAKYDGIDFNEDTAAQERYDAEYDVAFNKALANELYKTLGFTADELSVIDF